MKKILTSILALFFAGVNVASATDTYTSIYSRALTGDSAWVQSRDLSAWGDNALLSVDADYGLFFSTIKPSTSYSATKSFSITKDAKVKYELDWYTGNSTNKPNNYEYIQFGDKLRLSYNKSYNFYLNTDGTSSTGSGSILYYKGLNTYKIIVVFNTATSSVDSLMFGGVNLLDKVKGITFDGGFNSVTFGFQRGASTSNWAYPNGIVDIDVAESKQQVTNASYTVNYVSGSEIVKTITGNMAIGGQVTATRVVTSDDNTKYLVDDATLPSMTIADGTNTLDVNVHTPKTAKLKLTTTVAGESSVSTTDLTEADDLSCTWSCGYPLYKKGNDGLYYKADATTYEESGTFTDGEIIERTITYTESNPDIVFFADATDAGDYYVPVSTGDRYSNGEAGAVAGLNARDRGIAVGNISAGSYELVAKIVESNNRSVVLRSGTDEPFASILQTRADATGTKTVAFDLEKDTANVFLNGADYGDAKTIQTETFDYVYIVKIAELETTYSRTTAAGKYGTICLPRAFTVEGAKVYKASLNDANDCIELTEVASTQSGYPYIYQSTADEQTFTYVSGSTIASSPISNGVLYGVFADTKAPVGCYVLQTVNGVQQFGYVESGKNITITANKAYVVANASSEAKALSISLFDTEEDDVVTGVNAANTLNAIVNGTVKIYDINGRPLQSLQKGLNIVNGTKVFVK